jgi:hypothetical protein
MVMNDARNDAMREMAERNITAAKHIVAQNCQPFKTRQKYRPYQKKYLVT